MKGFRVCFAVLAAAMLAAATAGPAFAQQTESRIVGVLVDQQMGTMPGVTITVTSAATGAVRTEVTEGDGSYIITNLAPGAYTVQAELQGFGTQTKQVVLGIGQVENGQFHARHRGPPGSGDGYGQRDGARRVVGEDWRQRFAGGSRQSPGQRPELREPHDSGDRCDERRQRRVGECSLQRQVEPAELSELRRHRWYIRVRREPGLPQRHRLTVPSADVDGIGRRVPGEFRPRSGRERPRLGRQHHGRQQEREQSVQRLALRIQARRCARQRQQVRRPETGAVARPVRRVNRRSARAQQNLLLLQLRGSAADDRPQFHRGGAE